MAPPRWVFDHAYLREHRERRPIVHDHGSGTSAYGCTDTVTHQVLVHPVPNTSFMATPFNQLFPAATVNINNTTPAGAWTYGWFFGDDLTSTAMDPLTHTYGTWGTFTITLVVHSGVTDTARQDIVIASTVAHGQLHRAGRRMPHR